LPEWVVERGIGESRYARIEKDEIVEARILVEEVVPAGSELKGRLRRSGSQLCAEVDGQHYLLPGGAHGVTDGAPLTIEVTREGIPGVEPWKRPLARLIHGTARLVDKIAGRDLPVGTRNALDDAGWDDLLEEARTGIVHFEGGELRISPTPAMTLIDVDGTLPVETLARQAAAAAGRAIRRLAIGGSIGIDFPTVKGKLGRSSIAQALDDALPQPFERTTVNGFGFLQIVRPRRHASLLELAQDRVNFEARDLMRRIARDRSGSLTIVCHPALARRLKARPDWIAQLSRQVGGDVTLRSEPSLPIHAGYAEKS